ncbi:hypothetical protein [Pyrococcus yayanosii]|uniref:Uncharacterized protein n=1 Tax=Pyrococcus yayanosii (strain CH1 / JCM 16557) TaxID=529709 RepID=F8AIU7_PYRYC|nr:hypothetical protein [Pyrococcus yayanosii]AEH24422.1 hypothetical protein PYCH_07340 [Pyrococcus yayanosii CH1]
MLALRVIFYIEAIGNDKKAVETSISEIEKKLKDEKITLHRLEKGDVIEVEEGPLKYSAMLEVELEGEFGKVVELIMKYGPTLVELVDIKGTEINAKELMETLGKVSYFMGKLMKEFGGLAVYPSLEGIPEPRVGYSEDEIEEMILDEGMVRYQFVIKVYGNDYKELESNIKKALSLEGCRINKFVLQPQGEFEVNGKKRVEALVAAELLSTFETLFVLTAKYAPIGIAIVEPQIVEPSPSEIQNALSDLAALINELVHRPLANLQFGE